MKKRTGKMISLSLAVAMAMTAAPVTALAVDETVLTTAQNAGETGTGTTTVDAKEEEEPATGVAAQVVDEVSTPSTLEEPTIVETPMNDPYADWTKVSTATALQDAIDQKEDKILVVADIDLDENTSFTIDYPVQIKGEGGSYIWVHYNGIKSQGLFTFVDGSAGSSIEDINISLVAEGDKRAYIILFNNYTDSNAQTFIQNVEFSGGNDVNNSKTIAIAASGSSTGGNIKVTESKFTNLSYGLYMDSIYDFEFIHNEINGTKYNAINVGEDGGSDITIKDNKFTNISSMNFDYPLYSCGIGIGANANKVTISNNTISMLNDKEEIVVAHDAVLLGDTYYQSLEQAIEDANDGDIIKLTKDITVTSENSANNDPGVEIKKAITLDGNGKTIRPSGNFSEENSLLGVTDAKGNDTTPVVIKNLILDGENKDYVKHALNLYESTGVVIENVTAKNLKGYGLVVNSSEATVKSMDVSGCTWGAVNVDTKTNENSKLVIEDGTFRGSVWVEHSQRNDGSKSTGTSSVEINGGTFQNLVGSNTEDAAFSITGGDYQKETYIKGTSVNVTGGTFANDFTVYTDYLAINGGTFEKDVTNENGTGTNVITGGNFKGSTPEDSMPEYMTKDENGNLVVKPGNGYLKQAIDNAKDGDTLRLTTGEYTLNDNVCMTLDKELTISGEGSGTVVKGSSSANYGNGLFTFAAGSEGSTLKNMTIKYTATGVQTAAVYFNLSFVGTNANPTTIQNVDFKGGESLDSIGKEMAITSTYLNNGCGSLNISDCSFTNFAYAMYFNNISDLTVEDCVIDGTKYNAINIAADGDSSTSQNITLTGNTLTNISYANYEHDAYSSGIRLGEHMTGTITVTDNSISMLNGKKPIYVETSTPGTAKYVVLYKDGNTVIGQEIVEDGHSITLPNAPASSRTFRGWYNSEDGKTYQPKDNVSITKDTTFTAQWKSSGGSSHRYDGYITVINPKNGDVSVSDTLADEGDKITLTITPDKGYVVDKIEIVDLEGDKIDAKKVDDEDGKYTFRMENCDVTVTVTFKEEGKTTEDTDKEEDKDEETTETTELNFTDVKESDWFYKGVAYVVDKGIMSGVSENEFAPSGKLTRAMLVQMLYNMESRPACDAENAFMDVPVGQWYTDAVIWANDAKIVSGMGEGLFAPNMEITREQMVAMLYNYAKYKGYDVTASADLSKFADNASVSTWAQPAMQWAVAEGYISGMGDSQLAPQGTATRAEIASVIMRFMEATAETAE